VEQDHEMSCVHRWILSEPSKGSVRGTCRRCGARRSYPSGIQLPPPPGDEEEEVVLDLPALAAAIKSMKREILV
jgi:hypothetical protein